MLDVLAFLVTCKVKYCSLYDQGYTSIGSIHDTVPNALLSVNDTSSKEKFKPVFILSDGRSGTVEDQLGLSLCKKLTSVGWSVQQTSVLRNDIDSVSEEVDRQRSICDMVFIYGGVGPLHSDVTLAGVAKAFGVRLVFKVAVSSYSNSRNRAKHPMHEIIGEVDYMICSFPLISWYLSSARLLIECNSKY
ncbi:hypothetical protein Bca4012_012997 [Brassica carinata]